jgi:pimeloyl-ACP methyl ester carboxylesterase
MPPRRRFGKRLVRAFLPIVLVLLLALVGSLALIVYSVTRPPKRAYLVTPQSFQQFSGSALKLTEEFWSNSDGTRARGWLLKGAQGAPAVVLLHRYGADRSWLLNLAVKIHETSGFTILCPDLRGHGLDPAVKWTSFGAREGQDLIDALDFLHTLKADKQAKLVGDRFGVYGVELGAYAAISGAQRNNQIKTLVLDSIPRSPDDLLHAAVVSDIGVDVKALQSLAHTATKLYLMGAYENAGACELAASLRDQHTLLLSGADASELKETTAKLAQCFPNKSNVEARLDLPLSGLNLPSATGEQGEAYDRIVIEFFDRYLR